MKFFKAVAQRSLVPDAITYNALISACEKGKLSERALRVLEAMLQQGVMPDAIIHHSLISACEKDKRPERALKGLNGNGEARLDA